MSDPVETTARVVKSVHGLKELKSDPDLAIALAEYLRTQYNRDALLELYSRFAIGDGNFDVLVRQAIWRAMARRFGHSVHISSGVGFSIWKPLRSATVCSLALRPTSRDDSTESVLSVTMFGSGHRAILTPAI